MLKTASVVLAASAALLLGLAPGDGPASAPGTKQSPAAAAASAYVLGHTLKDIDGKEQDLSQYKGKVVLMVNVASKCGYTPQYKGLEALYQSRKDKGLVILGFPANEFGGQEPGDASVIKQTCFEKYHVSFPMFDKIAVKGKDQHPLYKQLASQPAPVGGDPKWNFTKFLVDRSGNVVARFEPATTPEDSKLAAKIDELLAAK